jgi:DinB superfamily
VTDTIGGPAPAWLLRLDSELDAADQRATAVAQGLTPQQLNWRRSPAEWSVGQCLEHLAMANEVYLRAMSGSLDGRRAGLVAEIAPGWFGRWFIRTVIEPSPRMRRWRAPKKIRPRTQVPPSVLDRFHATNRAIREFMQRARSYDVNRIRFKNPFFGIIRFTVGTGLEVMSRHERRHLLQAERIRAALAAAVRAP